MTSMRWRTFAARHRTTVLPAAAIAVAAATAPPGRQCGCRLRAAGRGGDTAATAVVLLAAQAPVAGTSWARLPASLAIAATTMCLVLALRTRRSPPS
ncbi:hypothetical protein ACH4HG_29515 [Streptomyces coeruleorubidus]|uniref:hypothetical protein n=1 Tax=Streptomyces coeruleorubidus TaxID=116188 RepID=UPI0037A1DEC1